MTWTWPDHNRDLVLGYLQAHVEISFVALALAAVVALPVALAAYRWPRSYPPVLSVAGVLYTIPSLALYVLLINVVGIGAKPVIIALAIYSLVIIIRNVVEGLRAVPADITDAAIGMGYRPSARLIAIDLPVAAPAVFAGLRAAAVSNISLVSVGALVGSGGLGQLFIQGFQVDNQVEIWTGVVATMLLALVVDLLILLIARAVTPWTKAAR